MFLVILITREASFLFHAETATSRCHARWTSGVESIMCLDVGASLDGYVHWNIEVQTLKGFVGSIPERSSDWHIISLGIP